jgi:hypothetical protein
MRSSVLLLILAAGAVAACSKNPETQPEPEMVGARINNNLEAPIRRGDCKEAVRRAVANPNIDVERVAAPLAMTPPPFDSRRMPKGATDRNGWYKVSFHVLVDTLGRPDMKTFTVDTASHAWFGTSVKNAVAKWKFAPAEVAGCKIPRNYSLGITPRGKTQAAPTKPAAKAPAKPTATKKPPVS